LEEAIQSTEIADKYVAIPILTAISSCGIAAIDSSGIEIFSVYAFTTA
jgi:hypothetical protein